MLKGLFKNKLINMMIILLIAVTLLGVVAFVLWQTYLKPAPAAKSDQQEIQQMSATEFQKVTFETDEIRTNLIDGKLILAKFAIQAENEKTRQELELRKPQVIHIIITTLSSMKPEDIQGAGGIAKMEDAIKKGLNPLLTEGKVLKVITTHKIIDM
ncbi:flagellar FliL protein [Aneurinibacillus soli]|uniref:Flagellar protein FliL n=1 Tax=Aneurinibacillus soli TaxID=1500254 RepID=A0A0U5BAB2_9BACL|nr:flagellar basal body-associated FliL family protein [Aneurinibacillus soli]PYE63391.1 flagellar FliL protein [Aneurinibacillus soli]BAU27677.1 flagellar basal body-associated protein FliL [Aneurinibacillus soli]